MISKIINNIIKAKKECDKILKRTNNKVASKENYKNIILLIIYFTVSIGTILIFFMVDKIDWIVIAFIAFIAFIVSLLL